MPNRRLFWTTAILLVVGLGSAAVALVVVDDHHANAIRITQLAVAGALVIATIAAVARLATSGAAGAVRSAERTDTADAGSTTMVELHENGAGRPAGLWVRLAGEGQRPFLVVSAERDNANFLVARDDEQAQWIPKDRIESWEVGPAES